MKKALYTVLILTTFISACGQETRQPAGNPENADAPGIINPGGHTLQTRISPPDGYQRIEVQNGSFAEYLRNLPLKPHNSAVEFYDGSVKPNHGIYTAVVDLEIGDRDLHQCADAVMRLRAEYLWMQERFDEIHFNFTNGFRVDYTKWMKGKRIVVNGNETHWKQAASPSNSYGDFWNYLEIIFAYAGTLSLSKELGPVDPAGMEPGDVFIRGGTPGHAVIVVDMAADTMTGEKVFLLAQSYMPAQDIQVLKNPDDKAPGPWYPLDFGQELITPEWVFERTDLKRFE